jgi:sodium/proline symporter
MASPGLDTPTTLTFVIYIVSMMALGVVAYRATHGLSDYLLGGRRLGSGVAALSAGASDMSGWLLLGLPGAVYASGLNQAWLAVGLACGAYLNWQLVARRLRRYTAAAGDAITLPDYLENRFADRTRLLRVIAATVILLFFAFYTASGLVAGAKLLESTFGVGYTVALFSGAAVIMAYTFMGGFLAVAWTDFAQGLLMLAALIGLPWAAVDALGGWHATTSAVGAIDPGYNHALHDVGVIGIISMLAWGLGYFGQPHILVRFMALRSEHHVPAARLIAISWMVVGLFGALLTGYAGLAYADANPGLVAAPFDSEKIFLVLTRALATPGLAGVLLAAVLAAVMSTIDSQLLVASSALSEDIYKPFIHPAASSRELVWVGRGAVLAVALAALVIARSPDSRVLGLVAYAWGGFGAAFGPVILLSLFWRTMTAVGAMAGMVVGAVTVIVWRPLSGGIFELFEIVPGFLLGGLAVVLGSLAGRPSAGVVATFERVMTARG